VSRRVPLRRCVAASNEWPSAFESSKELAAVFDRFVFRWPIRSADGRQRLLWGDDTTPMLRTVRGVRAAFPELAPTRVTLSR
jgi:MoxR-like ATPase